MRIITDIKEMTAFSKAARAAGKTVGLVPTMGFLHEGHLGLVREAGRKTDVRVVSIFVNPAQFGPAEDFDKYPRDTERDKALLEKEGVDCLFLPEAGDMYPAGYETWVEVAGLQKALCGKTRPGHFRGVATVVLKLFNIVQPDRAFFGWKDAQQLVVLRRMAADLNLGVALEGVPIVREADGLALSSRNTYLSPEQRKAALVLSRSLKAAEAMVGGGERKASAVLETIKGMIAGEPLARLDYAEIVGLDGLKELDIIEGEVLMALAVYFGRTRLIDNIRLVV